MPQRSVEEPNLEPSNSFSPLTGRGAHLRGASLAHFVERPFTQLFADQVAQNPTKLAIVCGDASLTFAELNERANQLANHLRSFGVGREHRAAICIDRSLEMGIGILGILKSGAAYVPLDPEYPSERLAFMIRNTQPSVVVTKSTLPHLIPDNSVRPILLDQEWDIISSQPNTNLSDQPRPADLAYVIHTSGSTGNPKGVMIEHANLANYLLALNHELEIQRDDIYLHMASIAFSSSRRQLMLPLSQGATVIIASSDQRKDPLALFELIKQRQVTVMDAVPSFWRTCTTILSELDRETRRELLDNKLRLMLSASEPLLSDIPRTWAIDFGHPARHVHMFGQTETAGIVCVNPSSIEDDRTSVDRVPMGKPIANTEVLVLDEEMNLCPAGVAGELYIGGAGIGRGYVWDSGLTAEKFVPHPFSDDPGARVYRTGDWALLREDGRLEFAGRRDQQIKVRGFRVELGEIESVIASHNAIRECAVIARNIDGNPKLTAYFVTSESAEEVGTLREFLRTRLPEYAVPSSFVRLDSLPLSANGKIDRLALVAADEVAPNLSSEYVAPRTEIEDELTRVWIELLGVERIGVDDNFFELGGHSLLATQVIARVRQLFNVDAPVSWLFEFATIRSLASRIEMASAADELSQTPPLVRVRRDQPLPMSFSQQRLWFLDQLDPNNYVYNIAHAIEISGPLNATALQQSLNMILLRHEVLRTRFVAVEGVPLQQIDLPAEIDWRQMDPRDEAEAQRLVEAESRRPFDLATGPLLRALLLRLAPDRFILLLTMHHIVTDGWSDAVLADELGHFYRSYERDEEASLPKLPVQYADFAVWHRDYLSTGRLDDQVEYWKSQLAGAPPVLPLPTDLPVPAVRSYRGAKKTVRLSTDLAHRLNHFSRSQGATLFMTLMAAFNLLLARYSGQDDVVVGSPIAGRNRVETESLIGFFVNTLPLRTKVSPHLSVRDLIESVRETALGGYANQEVPFEKLVSELQLDRHPEGNPIFQVMFVLQSGQTFLPQLQNLTVRKLELQSNTAKFDLALEAIDGNEGLDISVSYSTDLFEDESATCMLADFQLLLEAFVANPERPLSELPALSWKPKYAPATTATLDEKVSTAFVAPRTPIEEKLVSIWTEVLATDRVSVEDNFFALGGHSLMATQVIARVRSTFNYELPLRRLFETPTIAGLADAICENHADKTANDEFAAMMAELEALTDDEARAQVALEQAA
jgi:amino acid adenylation domain-containing protein